MKWTKFFTLFLALNLFINIWATLYARPQSRPKEARLTLAQILTGLQTQGVTVETRTLTARNKYIAQRIRERGVTFSLTAELERRLRNAGASEELLEVIQTHSPPTRTTSQSKRAIPNSMMDFNTWWEGVRTRAEKISKLKQSRYDAYKASLDRGQTRERTEKGAFASKALSNDESLIATTKKYRNNLEGLLAALVEQELSLLEALEKKRQMIAQGKMVKREIEPQEQKLTDLRAQIRDTQKRITQADKFIAEAMNRQKSPMSQSVARDFSVGNNRLEAQISDATNQYVAFLKAWPQGDQIITNASTSPRIQILYQEKAKYTAAARQNRVEGTVIISTLFTADGRVSDIHVIRSLPDGLEEEAIKAAREIVFLPALKDGKPVSVRMTIEFTFNLNLIR